MAFEELQIALNRGKKSSIVIYLDYLVLKKHLVHKAQNLSPPLL